MESLASTETVKDCWGASVRFRSVAGLWRQIGSLSAQAELARKASIWRSLRVSRPLRDRLSRPAEAGKAGPLRVKQNVEEAWRVGER